MFKFESVVLYQHDLDSLLPGQWITDSILEFWLDHVTKDSCAGYLGPSVVHWIRDSTQSIPLEFLDLVALNSNVLLVPINDHTGEEVGGTHWSLAVYFRELDKWYYYDSLCHDTKLAEITCQAIYNYIKSGIIDFSPVNITQQTNNYDCGVYVIILSEMLSKGEIPKDVEFDSKDTRQRVLNIIKLASEMKHS